MKKAEELYNSLNEIDDTLIEEAANYKNPNKNFRRWLKPLAAVACLAIAVTAVLKFMPKTEDEKISNQTEESEISAEAELSAVDYNITYPSHSPVVTKTSSVGSELNFDCFDSKFLDYISKNVSGNYMVSPLSFRYALGLLTAGASGSTKQELMNVLGVTDDEQLAYVCSVFNGFEERFKENLEKELENFDKYIEEGYISEDSEKPYRALRVANSIWKREDITEDFKESYKEYIGGYFGAEYMNFNASDAVERINQWASDKTEKMIQKLLPEGYDARNLSVVLMNALYFKDSWCSSFVSASPLSFTTESGKTVKKDSIKSEDSYKYYEDSETQLVVIPMSDGVYMTFVIGSTENLSAKVNNSKYEDVIVTIPKIDLETSLSDGELCGFLKENGVSAAFSPDDSDFSAMIDYKIYVGDIIQKTKLKLDEDGVEAAAVTEIMIKEGCEERLKPLTFTADKPFSFYIYTTVNGVTEIMFAGEINE